MSKIIKTFDKVIVLTLLWLMMLVFLLSSLGLAVILVQELLKPPILLLSITQMLEVFSLFLMVLIVLELIESIKYYLKEHRVRAEVIFLVAIYFILRKVIILEYKDISPEILYGMSAVIIALGIGYFLVQRALSVYASESKPTTGG